MKQRSGQNIEGFQAVLADSMSLFRLDPTARRHIQDSMNVGCSKSDNARCAPTYRFCIAASRFPSCVLQQT